MDRDQTKQEITLLRFIPTFNRENIPRHGTSRPPKQIGVKIDVVHYVAVQPETKHGMCLHAYLNILAQINNILIDFQQYFYIGVVKHAHRCLCLRQSDGATNP